MSASEFSFAMSLIWTSILSCIVCLACKHPKIIRRLGVPSVLLLCLLILLRLLLPVEFTATKEINSTGVYAAFDSTLKNEAIGTVSLLQILVFIWVTGSVLLMTRYIYRNVLFQYRLRRLLPIKSSTVNTILKQVAGTGHIRVIESDAFPVPVVTGLFAPVILIPPMDFTVTQLYYIMKHEWMHYLHKDIWISLALDILACLFWWFPCIHLLRSMVDRLLEVRCDHAVLRNLSIRERIEYLDILTAVFLHARRHRERQPRYFGRSMNTGTSAMKLRLEFIQTPIQPQCKHTYILLLAAVAVFLLSYAFILQPAYYDVPANSFFSEDVTVSTDENSELVFIDTHCVLQVGGKCFVVKDEHIDKLSEQETQIIFKE